MAIKDTIPVSIYLLDEKLEDNDTFRDLTLRVILQINANRKEKFQNIDLSTQLPDGFQIRLFHCFKKDPPNWSAFLQAILPEDSPLTKIFNSTNSFICFVEHYGNVYVITGGIGSIAIEPFISTTFGLDILTKIINSDEKIVKEIKERGVTGALLGNTKFYRGDQSISSFDDFGKIIKLVNASLNHKILVEALGFSRTNLKRKTSRCVAKDSFKLFKAIRFDQFLSLIETFTSLLCKEEIFALNKIRMISKRKPSDKKLREVLLGRLVEKVYTDVCCDRSIDFDFCHMKYEEYHTAESYKISFDSEDYFTENDPISFDDLINKLRSLGKLHTQSIELFNQSVLKLTLTAFDYRGEEVCIDPVLYHLHGEIQHERKTYFFIDREWYYIHPDFVNDLNESCQKLLRQCWEPKLIQELYQLNEDERDFNARFCHRKDTWVLDTITHENIEICDILIEKDGLLHLIHVKTGFNNRMRDLAAQVLIAAKRVQRAINSDSDYFKYLEEHLTRGINSNSSFRKKLAGQSLPEGGLRKLFNRRDDQIIFCLAFVDTVEGARSFEKDYINFNSNIAKYSLITLKKEIQSMGFKFKLIQINKTV